MNLVLVLICAALGVYLILLVLRLVLSWFPLRYDTLMHKLLRICEKVSEPLLVPMRRAIPPVQAGSMSLDLSLLILVIVGQVIWQIVCGGLAV